MEVTMNPEKPAQGILKRSDFGDAKAYEILCDCGNEEHYHSIWIEADDVGVSVNIESKTTTDYWVKLVEPRYDIDNDFLQWWDNFWKHVVNQIYTRSRLVFAAVFKGYITTYSNVLLTEQQALNY